MRGIGAAFEIRAVQGTLAFMEYTVRKATAKDFPVIREIIAAHAETLLQNHLPKANEFFVALDSTKTIVGCVALAIYSKRLAEVRSLAVLESVRGQGIATKLVTACLAEAKRKKIYEVLAITGTKKFFEKCGFSAFQKEKLALLKVLG